MLATADFEIVNPGHHLATLDSPDARLSVEMMVEPGTGYRAAAEVEPLPTGTLPVDAVFSPVRKANYTVESVRVGTGANMERLVIEVWTDKAISPVDALKAAADTMMQDLYLVTVAKNDVLECPTWPPLPPALRNMRIEELGLTARTQNALRRRGYKLAHELITLSQSDLMSIRGVGKTSVDELMERLEEMGFFAEHEDTEAGT